MRWWLCLLLVVSVAYAHGGRTDKAGCHVDSSTSKRHCHNSEAGKYDRAAFGFVTYGYPAGTLSFYTGDVSCPLEVEHVVALKDAFDSGANKWPRAKKELFANDKDNHVPACTYVNRSKGAATPSVFLRRSNDGKGTEYTFAPGKFCAYVAIYFAVKRKYALSFANNSPATFASCNIHELN